MTKTEQWNIIKKSYDWMMKKMTDVPFTGRECGESITFTFGEWKNAVANDLPMEDWIGLVNSSATEFRMIMSKILNRANLRVRHGGSRLHTPILDHSWTIVTIDRAPRQLNRLYLTSDELSW